MVEGRGASKLRHDALALHERVRGLRSQPRDRSLGLVGLGTSLLDESRGPELCCLRLPTHLGNRSHPDVFGLRAHALHLERMTTLGLCGLCPHSVELGDTRLLGFAEGLDPGRQRCDTVSVDPSLFEELCGAKSCRLHRLARLGKRGPPVVFGLCLDTRDSLGNPGVVSLCLRMIEL